MRIYSHILCLRLRNTILIITFTIALQLKIIHFYLNLNSINYLKRLQMFNHNHQFLHRFLRLLIYLIIKNTIIFLYHLCTIKIILFAIWFVIKIIIMFCFLVLFFVNKFLLFCGFFSKRVIHIKSVRVFFLISS